MSNDPRYKDLQHTTKKGGASFVSFMDALWSEANAKDMMSECSSCFHFGLDIMSIFENTMFIILFVDVAFAKTFT